MYNRAKEVSGSFFVSEVDFDEVAKYKWSFSGNYPQNSELGRLSRWLLRLKDPTLFVDHIDGNPLNNTRENLRLATPSLNSHNRKTRGEGRFVGTRFKACRSKWEVQLAGINYGSYEKEEHAALAYNHHATRLYGKAARLNEVDEDPSFVMIEVKRRTRDIKGLVKRGDKWAVQLQSDKRTLHYGLYATENEAKAAAISISSIEACRKKGILLDKEITRNETGVAVIEVKGKWSKGFALVDDNKWHELSQYSWCGQHLGYVKGLVQGKQVLMHQVVYGQVPVGKVIDHLNHDPYDNRRDNLREASRGENAQNRTPKKRANGLPIGVNMTRHKTKYFATITHKRKQIHIGTFETAEDAALAYDTKALELYGAQAMTNQKRASTER